MSLRLGNLLFLPPQAFLDGQERGRTPWKAIGEASGSKGDDHLCLAYQTMTTSLIFSYKLYLFQFLSRAKRSRTGRHRYLEETPSPHVPIWILANIYLSCTHMPALGITGVINNMIELGVDSNTHGQKIVMTTKTNGSTKSIPSSHRC